MIATVGRVALLDWDNSLHRGWALEGWVRHLSEHHEVDPVLVERWEALRDAYEAGEVTHDDLAHRANQLYATWLRGRRVEDVEALVAGYRRVAGAHGFHPFVAPLLALLRAYAIEPVVVTGAPLEVVRALGSPLGIGRVEGLTLVADDGRYTGEIDVNPGVAATKGAVAERVAAEGHEVVLAVGDSPSDRPLLLAARAKVVVGDRELAASLGASAVCVAPEDDAGEVVALVRGLLEASGACA